MADYVSRVDKYNNDAIPICPTDRVKLDYIGYYDSMSEDCTKRLKCEDCNKLFIFQRDIRSEKRYVIEKVRSLDRKDYEIVDIDGALTPVTKKESIKKTDYFLTTQIRESKRGPQVVIYAGIKGQKEKSQIFITPEERRLSFDQKDINPADLFAKITAEFNDKTIHTVTHGKQNNNKRNK